MEPIESSLARIDTMPAAHKDGEDAENGAR